MGSHISSIHRLGGAYGTDQTVYRLQECPCVGEKGPRGWVEKSPHPQSRLGIGKLLPRKLKIWAESENPKS